MNTPSDSAIAQAFYELSDKLFGTPEDEQYFHVLRSITDRASEIDAAQPAAAGELPEAVAYCAPFLANNAEAFAWPGTGRKPIHAAPLYTERKLIEYAADQLRAAVAGNIYTIKTEVGELPCSLAVATEWDKREEWVTEAVAGYRRDAERVANALLGIVEIGKRDLTNPKYDAFFEEARAALANLGSGDGKEGDRG